MSAKIAYDYQIFCNYLHGGVSRYFCEIAPLIEQDDDYEVKIVSPLYINKYLQESNLNIIQGWPVRYVPKVSKYLVEPINFQLSKLLLAVDQPNIVHETYYSLHSVAPKNAKRVITVYDMIHEKYSSYVDPKQEFAKIKELSIKRADHIVCISESTKKDLIEFLEIDEAKISTIYLAHKLNNCKLEKEVGIESEYLLYVGQRGSYKNFNRLLEAYSKSKKLSRDFKLVCFGGGYFSNTEIGLINDLQVGDRVIQKSGDDERLASLYRYAAAFIYPSLYEGFGIPPLEAMSLNCPVVCSNVSSIPEIVGNAGEYFDPHDIDSMIYAIENVVYSQHVSNKIRKLGLERAKIFSWESCAQQTKHVYKSLL